MSGWATKRLQGRAHARVRMVDLVCGRLQLAAPHIMIDGRGVSGREEEPGQLAVKWRVENDREEAEKQNTDGCCNGGYCTRQQQNKKKKSLSSCSAGTCGSGRRSSPAAACPFLSRAALRTRPSRGGGAEKKTSRLFWNAHTPWSQSLLACLLAPPHQLVQLIASWMDHPGKHTDTSRRGTRAKCGRPSFRRGISD